MAEKLPALQIVDMSFCVQAQTLPSVAFLPSVASLAALIMHIPPLHMFHCSSHPFQYIAYPSSQSAHHMSSQPMSSCTCDTPVMYLLCVFWCAWYYMPCPPKLVRTAIQCPCDALCKVDGDAVNALGAHCRGLHGLYMAGCHRMRDQAPPLNGLPMAWPRMLPALAHRTFFPALHSSNSIFLYPSCDMPGFRWVLIS